MTISLDLTRPESRAALRPVATEKPSLVGMDREEMAHALGEAGVPERQRRMRVQQLWHWLYVRGVSDFDDMRNVSKDLRASLSAHFTIARPEIVEEQISNDGTRKWLLRFPSRGAGRPVEIETVYIPEEGRGTLCISSQVGCTLTCSFCHTGTQKLVRNLTSEEILAQLLIARDRLGDFPERDTPAGAIVPAEGRNVTNIVMMGMGEPLYNFEQVKKALLIAADGEGLSLSKRRITLSTSGLVPEIHRTGAEIGVMLAISLHAVRDDLRDMLVPINKKYPIEGAARRLPELSGPFQCAAHHLRICDAEGRQRFHRGRQGTGAAAQGHPGQDQPDPVQPLARFQLSVLRVGDDRGLRRLREPRRLRLPDPHPARPRHPGRLRTAQVGIGAHAQIGPVGPGSHDDCGTRRGLRRFYAYLWRLVVILAGFAAAAFSASMFLNLLLFSTFDLLDENYGVVSRPDFWVSVAFFTSSRPIWLSSRSASSCSIQSIWPGGTGYSTRWRRGASALFVLAWSWMDPACPSRHGQSRLCRCRGRRRAWSPASPTGSSLGRTAGHLAARSHKRKGTARTRHPPEIAAGWSRKLLGLRFFGQRLPLQEPPPPGASSAGAASAASAAFAAASSSACLRGGQRAPAPSGRARPSSGCCAPDAPRCRPPSRKRSTRSVGRAPWLIQCLMRSSFSFTRSPSLGSIGFHEPTCSMKRPSRGLRTSAMTMW
jgi:23S rRNA (adenine2503-C2)-methyltransferase